MAMSEFSLICVVELAVALDDTLIWFTVCGGFMAALPRRLLGRVPSRSFISSVNLT